MIKSIFRFANDMIAVCDESGRQITEFQGAWADVARKIAKELIKQGHEDKVEMSGLTLYSFAPYVPLHYFIVDNKIHQAIPVRQELRAE